MLNSEINTKALDSYLYDWLHNHDFDCDVQLGTDFEFWNSTDTIQYTLLITQQSRDTYEKFLEECGVPYADAKYNISMFTWCFLHELGHYMTQDEQTIKMWDECEEYMGKIENKELTNKDYYNYYGLEIERLATHWAIDFVTENRKEVLKLNRRILSLLWDIYDDVGLIQ